MAVSRSLVGVRMRGRLPSRRADRLPSRPNPPDSADRRPGRGADRPPAPRLDVVAVGNALVDVLARPPTRTWRRSDLVKGTMVLVDHARSAAIYDHHGADHRGLGRIGGQHRGRRGRPRRPGRLPGRVADDQLGPGLHPRHPLHRGGLRPDAHAGRCPGEAVTGHCLVLVTEDAERTMATHLGVASEFGAVDLHDGHLASAQVVYLEGYLWEQPSAKAAMRRGHRGGPRQRRRGGPHRVGPVLRRSTTGPSSSSCSNGDLELLFANEEEVMMLFGAATSTPPSTPWPRPACWPS